MKFLNSIINKFTGADDAADAQAGAAQQAAALSKEQFEMMNKNLAPYRKLGARSLYGLASAAKDIDPEQALSDFYSSGEYGIMSAQANNDLMAQQEALGGLGSSAAANSLQRVAPMLGQQHLAQIYGQQADRFNRYMGMANLGQNAAAQTGAAGQNYASQAGQAYQQAGEARANEAMAAFNTKVGLANLFSGAGAF